MKKILMAITVPECFEFDGDQMEINIKGMPKNVYVTAEILKDTTFITHVRRVNRLGIGDILENVYECSNCHFYTDRRIAHCPNCGRRIIRIEEASNDNIL